MCTLQIDPEAEAACIKKKEHLSFIAGNKKRVFIIPPAPPLSPGPGACKERKPLISRIFCTKKKTLLLYFPEPLVDVLPRGEGEGGPEEGRLRVHRVAGAARQQKDVGVEGPEMRLFLGLGFGFNAGSYEIERLKVKFTAHQTISMTDGLTVGLAPP